MKLAVCCDCTGKLLPLVVVHYQSRYGNISSAEMRVYGLANCVPLLNAHRQQITLSTVVVVVVLSPISEITSHCQFHLLNGAYLAPIARAAGQYLTIRPKNLLVISVIADYLERFVLFWLSTKMCSVFASLASYAVWRFESMWLNKCERSYTTCIVQYICLWRCRYICFIPTLCK